MVDTWEKFIQNFDRKHKKESLSRYSRRCKLSLCWTKHHAMKAYWGTTSLRRTGCEDENGLKWLKNGVKW